MRHYPKLTIPLTRFRFRQHASAEAEVIETDGNADLGECVAAYLQHDYDTALTLCCRGLESGDLSNAQTANALNARGAVYADGKGGYDNAIQDYGQAQVRVQHAIDICPKDHSMFRVAQAELSRM
jgi:hypothetical protein